MDGKVGGASCTQKCKPPRWEHSRLAAPRMSSTTMEIGLGFLLGLVMSPTKQGLLRAGPREMLTLNDC